MKKRFNVTGVCFPAEHYMADVSAKIARVLEMAEQGDYFAINRPRQYGKTTTLFQLSERLNQLDGYIALRISFEGVGDDMFRSEAYFCPSFLDLLQRRAVLTKQEKMVDLLVRYQKKTFTLQELSNVISALVIESNTKIILIIDEIDKSSNNQLFVSFLGLLRDKYLERSEIPTFHSVILAGVHDVKSLKLKFRPEDEKKYNSPWNVAADFKVNMNIQPEEMYPMLAEYGNDRGVAIDVGAVAERIFYYTSGYPFLVSKLCKIFDEELLDTKSEKTWTAHDVDTAANQLIGETNTNFDDLIKNIRNNPDLYKLVQNMLIEGQEYSYAPNSDRINLGLIYGVFSNQKKRLAIHNRIYQEVILDYMSANEEHTSKISGREYSGAYRMPGNRFDLRKALLKFQELLKTEYSKKERDFLERQGRLVFLSFLKPLLNGHGHTFKEPQISEERRLDIIITYYQHQHIIELKVWRGQKAHEAGLDQLADYLDRLGLNEGALVIFDRSEVKEWKQEDILHRGKRIFAVWV